MSRMEFWTVLLASGLSMVVGVIAGFLTHPIIGFSCAVTVFVVVVCGAGSYRTISEKFFRKETQVRREIRQQQSNVRGDTARPTERQAAPEGVAVRKEPEKRHEALAESERNSVLSGAKSTPTTRESTMLCARCGQALRDGVRFCEKCGAKVGEHAPESAPRTTRVRLCGNCGCAVASNSKTCKWCGAELK